MKITILGSGTSTGVPQIGCSCKVCTSPDFHDKRLRASALVETEDARILIDCGPDFREQILHCEFKALDGVLITHEHYDHVGGLDDLRPFCTFGDITIYADCITVEAVRLRMPYCFSKNRYPGVPKISLEEVSPHTPFKIKGTEIIPIRVMHGRLPILGYRIGNIAYITDLKTLPDEEWTLLENLDCLIVNALRPEPHDTHQSIADAIAMAKRVGAKDTYFIHMSHQAGLHTELQHQLPEHIHLTYDGMVIHC